MKKLSSWRIFFSYLKEEKLKFILYVILVITSCLPAFIAALWGVAVEYLVANAFHKFVFCVVLYEGIYILTFTVLEVPREYLYNYLENYFMKRVTKDLYHKINNLPAVAFEEMSVGEFVNRMYFEPEKIMELLNKLIRLLCRAIVVIILVFFSFYISWVLGLEILVMSLMMGFISYQFLPKIKKNNEIIKKQSDKYVKEATENISGVREIKALGIKRHVEEKLNSILDVYYQNVTDLGRKETWYYALNNLLYFVFQLIIFLTAGYFYAKKILSLSLFMTLETYIWQIDQVVESLSDFGVSFNKVTVSLERINEILSDKLYKEEKYGEISLDKNNGKIEFKNVSFKYRETEDNTLENLNMTFLPNKKNAIVGRSGNGKSTIFNLLLRYFDVNDGEILIDGVNIEKLTEASLRKNISIIRQTPFIFNMSIFDNLKIVKEDLTLEEAREVCKKAYVDDYFMSLKDGYDTMIGEAGINLSGGQKQRLAIARTLLLDTKVILWDEATSALDNESQAYIKKTIDDLVKDHTVIIVAHRLSTIVDADIIHVIEKGKEVGLGTHKELLKNNQIYRNLYQNEEK
uniref:ABC transporter ATP-binding protein n=1 Tax=Candidatus Ventrenecus sp. TaxID=3085654 RepID=UPI0040273709